VKWQAGATAFEAQHGRRQRVFCASLADVFDNQANAKWRFDLFALIAATPSLDWLLLTKRPQNIQKMLPGDWGSNGRHNVWLGTTAEDQARFDQRWPILAKIPASVRFISYEPAIGAVRLHEGAVQPDWLISGGESGHGARPMNPQWARDIVSDCNRLGVAPFHKQWGSIKNNPLVAEQGMETKLAAGADTHGKGGGLVDGRLWREFPNPRGLLTVAA
jgi:protein gp37